MTNVLCREAMHDWETRLNRFLLATDREVLQDAGTVTAEIANAHAESEFEKCRIVQERLFESDFDRLVADTKRLGDGAAKGPSRNGRSRARRAKRQLGALVALATDPSAIQRRSSGGGQTAPRCSARCFARHMRSSVSASTSAASSIRRSTSARRSSRAALGSAASNGGAWAMHPPLSLPSRRQSSAFRDSSRPLSGFRTHATLDPSTVAGQLESASLSRRARLKFS